jgi:hypothetical protein
VRTIAPGADSKAMLLLQFVVGPFAAPEFTVAGPESMALIQAKLHLLFRFVKFAGLLLRLHLADDFFKKLHRLKAGFAFKTFDVQLDFAGFANSNFKFALGHMG